MEQENTIDFKSLRAKFQDEAAAKQVINKPDVPQKPRQVTSSGGPTSFLSSINTAVENKMPIMPRVVFKDEKKWLHHKPPESVPTSPQAKANDKKPIFSNEESNQKLKQEGDVVKQALKYKKLPPMPLTPAKEEKPEPEPELLPPDKSTLPQQPLKLTKTLKPDTELPVIRECSSKVSITQEPAGQPVKKSTIEAPKLENGIPASQISEILQLQSPKSNSPGAHTPDGKKVEVPVCKTPPCDRRVLKALEKAKKKVSPHQSFLPSMPKSTPQNEEDPSAELVNNELHLELPPVDYEHSLLLAPTNQSTSISPASRINGTSQNLHITALKDVAVKDSDPAFQTPQLDVLVHEKTGFGVPPGFTDFQMPDFNAAEFETAGVGVSEPEAVEYGAEDYEANHSFPEHEDPPISTPEAQSPGPMDLQFLPDSPGIPGVQVANDALSNSKPHKGQNKSKNPSKAKGPPKNPYAEVDSKGTGTSRSSWFRNSRHEKDDKKGQTDGPDDKELKKKERQRLEKEKKEQREREKKENEMKKKFKITGQEETMYQAKVTVASKGRKNDLAVKSGDIVNIIRTNNCPKGKWLARDSSNKYGYITVKDLELDIQEMLEMGKKAAQAAGRNTVDGETVSTGSRSSNQYLVRTGSFTDDSEEWTGDDEEHLSPTESRPRSQPFSVPENYLTEKDPSPQQSQHNGTLGETNVQARQEALQKLAIFFQHQKATSDDTAGHVTIAPIPVIESSASRGQVHSHLREQEDNSFLSDMLILPPPDLYADMVE